MTRSPEEPRRDADGGASPGAESGGGRRFRALVAGVGNVLRGDDGFGPAVIGALQGRELPEGTDVGEYGIGGLHIVQELMAERYAALVLVDAVDRGARPGTLFELCAEVPDVRQQTPDDARLLEVDLHQTDPSRILIMARALGVLPPRVRIVGCQPRTTALDSDLSPAVARAVDAAADTVQRLLATFSGEYDPHSPT